MGIGLKKTLPTGETTLWSLKEIIQGRPIDRPKHPMVVHFPIAFYIGALGLDILSRAGRFTAAPLGRDWAMATGNGTVDSAKGELNQASETQRAAGRATGEKRLEWKGAAAQVKGNLQESKAEPSKSSASVCPA
jgi:uncharacterized protein YjbJ (UPF0337 family)